MLQKTVEQHPLLNGLLAFKSSSENLYQFFGLHESKLSRVEGENVYRIGTQELRTVFLHLCNRKNSDKKAIQIFLDFNYSALSALPPSHPFYVSGNPAEDLRVVLSGLFDASNSDAKETFDYLLDKYRKPIEGSLQEKDAFNPTKAEVLSVLAKYHPALVVKHLQAHFSSPFTLDKAKFKSKAYRDIVLALRIVAVEKEHFEFVVNTLLMLAAEEGELGLYPGYEKSGLDWSYETSQYFEFYKAPFQLEDLFVNACSDTKVTLRERMGFLSRMLDSAQENNDYYRLYFLMHTLARGANVFEAGEYEYIEDPFFGEYIKFCINSLLRFAGEQPEDVDEGGLHLTAEEKLHELLELSIDEPDIWGVQNIPFIILRGFLHHNREWNSSPIYILSKLEGTIERLKKEKEKTADDLEHIKNLELRLEQLISLIGQREFVVEQFILYLGANKPHKLAEIGVDLDRNTGLDLHERQSLAERLIFARTTNMHDIERGWPKTTYLIASFGLAISDRPHMTNGNHKRVFKTISIKVEDFVIAEQQGKTEGHAEEALYAFLLREERVMSLLESFKQRYGIKAAGHKVYAVVLDLHGTYDMCLSCSEKGLDFQNKFRELLLKCLPAQRLKGLTHYPEQLPVIIRYSSDFKYDYPRETLDTKRGILTMYRQQTSRHLEVKPDSSNYRNRDVKYYGPNLLVHGKDNWHSFWSGEKRTQYKDKEVSLESWTAFVTARTSSSLTQEARHFNYTRLGVVETSDSPITELEGAMANTVIGGNVMGQAQKSKKK